MVGIYKITNPKGEIYIGCTINWDRRLYEYKNLKVKGQSKIYHSLLEFGWSNHKFEIIEECIIDKLYEREIFYIIKFDSVENGLNLRLGGRNGNLTQITKDKISKKLKGRNNTWTKKGSGLGTKRSEKDKEKMRKPRKNGGWERDNLVSSVLVNEIRVKYQTGKFTRSSLSREYGVSWGTIKNITDYINSYKD